MSNEVTTTSNKPVRLIDEWRESVNRMSDQFKMALPAHIPVERFTRVVMTALQNNPKLMACSKQSFFNAAAGWTFSVIMGTAGLGLMGGLAYGAWVASQTPRTSPTDDILVFIAWVVCLLLYGAIGFVGPYLKRVYNLEHDYGDKAMLAQNSDRVIQSLERISVPTLVLVGANDTNFIAATDYMAAKIRGAARRSFPTRATRPTCTSPRVSIRRSRRFWLSCRQTSDLTLRSGRRPRLEGWATVRGFPPFETRPQ